MKQKDIMLILVVVFISGFASFFISRIVITSPKNRSAKVEVVEKITTDFPEVDKKYFNSNALDPTQLIHIGESSNADPFKTPSQ